MALDTCLLNLHEHAHAGQHPFVLVYPIEGVDGRLRSLELSEEDEGSRRVAASALRHIVDLRRGRGMDQSRRGERERSALRNGWSRRVLRVEVRLFHPLARGRRACTRKQDVGQDVEHEEHTGQS